jgi:hypothetical protein
MTAPLPEEPHIHHVFLEKPFSGEGVNVPAVLKEDYDKLRAHAIAKTAECERLREALRESVQTIPVEILCRLPEWHGRMVDLIDVPARKETP